MKPLAKPGELKVVFANRHDGPDIYYGYGGDGANKCDGMFLSRVFEDTKFDCGRNLRQELEYRGYDITTFKFSIQKKKS